MVELEQLNIHSSRDIIARHGLTLPELFALSLEFYKEGSYCLSNCLSVCLSYVCLSYVCLSYVCLFGCLIVFVLCRV